MLLINDCGPDTKEKYERKKKKPAAQKALPPQISFIKMWKIIL